MKQITYLLISFLLGLFIGLTFFYKYWQIQDYRMFPDEIVVATDSTIFSSPTAGYFQSQEIQNSINECYSENGLDSSLTKINNRIKIFSQDRYYDKIYLLEVNENNFKIYYDYGLIITKDSITRLYKYIVITEEEFEKKYHRKYKHFKSKD